MIKINLKGDYIDESVKGIFLKLANSIIPNLQGINFELYDARNTKIPITEENIYQFLISKDFYKYNYKVYGNFEGITNEIIKDWLALPCGNAISSLYKPRITSKEHYKDFFEKHNSYNKEFFDNLKLFQQNNNNITAKNKPNFLKINYPSYYSIVNC